MKYLRMFMAKVPRTPVPNTDPGRTPVPNTKPPKTKVPNTKPPRSL